MSFIRNYISNAKINLGLTIPFRYENGYHHIISLFSPIDLYDEIKVSIIFAEKNTFSLTWENQLPSMFYDENTNLVFSSHYKDNLIYKAYEWILLLLEEHSIDLPSFECRVHIKKKIPSPAGLGGGSSNAAIMICVILDFIKASKPTVDISLWKSIELDIERQSLKLGSDIPFFLNNFKQKQTALISGTGEIFKSFPQIEMTGIIGIPGFGFSTRSMYQSLDKPVYPGLRDEIINSLPHLFVRDAFSNSKKSLHDDNLLIDNLYSIDTIHEDYINLYELLTNGNNLEPTTLNEKSFEKLVHIENERTYFLNNEFIGISKILFPEKYIMIEKIRREAIEKISQGLLSVNMAEKLVSSMSGSGAAIYAGVIGKNGFTLEFQQKLDFSVSCLQEEYPEVHWIKFCTLT